MSETSDSNKIVIGVVTTACIFLALVAAWSLSSQKLDLKKELRNRKNVESPISKGKTETLGADKINIPVPPFRFPCATGGEFGSDDLKGKLWVAEFMFTSCGGFCPEMSKMTELLQDRTEDLPDLHFVSFTVDPERDTLLALKEYGEEYHADNKRWHFLRAKLEEVHALGRKGFFLLNDTDSLVHSKKVALVDRNGRIRGYFDGAGPERVSDFKALELLIRDIYEKGDQ